MKKILLQLILILMSTQLYAIIIPTPNLKQTQYRWRNDDGNETSATWKAAANTAITINDTNALIRLRIELNNTGNGAAANVAQNLEYSTNNGTSWTVMSNAATDAFVYIASPSVANGLATTNQMGSATVGTFAAGKIVSAVGTAAVLNDGGRTEYEWVIKPTSQVSPTTYIFRSSGQDATPVVYPEANVTPCALGIAITSSKDSGRCGPGILQLEAIASAGTTVDWYDSPTGGTSLGTGSTFLTPLLYTSTTYYAQASFGTTCETQRIPLTASISPGPVINLGPDTAICDGKTLSLFAGIHPQSAVYLWNTGNLTATEDVTEAGMYTVKVQDSLGCYNIDTINVSVLPLPTAHSIAIADNTGGAFVYTIIGAQEADSYVWDFGDNVGTATGPGPVSYTYTTPGIYTVTVTLSNDCGEVTISRTINIKITDVADIAALGKEFSLFPNPGKDKVTIKYSGNVKMNSVSVYNLMGQKVYNASVKDNLHILNVSALANGIYNVIIDTERGRVTKKLEIIK